MRSNVGRTDALIRLVLAVVLVLAAAVFNSAPFVAIVAAVAGVGLAGTGLTRRCPLYSALGFDTSDGSPTLHRS